MVFCKRGLVAAAVTVTAVAGFGYTEVAVPTFCDDVNYGAAHMDFDWLFAQNSYWSPNATLYALYNYGEGTYGVFPHEAFGHAAGGGGGPAALNFAGAFISGTAGGFTCTDEGVVMHEGFLNFFMSCQAVAFVKETCPGKKILYSTHSNMHGDHNFGSYAWHSEEITYVRHKASREALEDAHFMEEEVDLMIAPDRFGFGAANGIQESAALMKTRPYMDITDEDCSFEQDCSFTLGSHTFHQFAPGWMQSEGDVITYIEPSNVMFAGNIFGCTDPVMLVPAAGGIDKAAVNLGKVLTWMETKGIAPRIQTGHGLPYILDAKAFIQFNIDYLQITHDLALAAVIECGEISQECLMATCDAAVYPKVVEAGLTFPSWADGMPDKYFNWNVLAGIHIAMTIPSVYYDHHFGYEAFFWSEKDADGEFVWPGCGYQHYVPPKSIAFVESAAYTHAEYDKTMLELVAAA